MKERDKENLIKTLPLVVLVVITANITSVLGISFWTRIIYFALAGAIGGLIGYFILKFIKKKNE